MAQLVKTPPAMQETWVQSLGWKDPLEKGKTTHSSILAWRIPCTTVHGVAKSWTWLSNFHFQRIPHINKFSWNNIRRIAQICLGQQHRIIRWKKLCPSKLSSRFTLTSLIFYETSMHAHKTSLSLLLLTLRWAISLCTKEKTMSIPLLISRKSQYLRKTTILQTAENPDKQKVTLGNLHSW